MSEILFFKSHAENEAGRLAPNFFLLFKKALCKVKQVVSTLDLIYFGRPPLWHKIKTNFITFQTADLKMCSILIFYKRVWG